MQEQDKFISHTIIVTVRCAFPPVRNRILRLFRPILRLLRIHRSGDYSIILHQMNIEIYFRYMQVFMQLFARTDTTDLMQAITDGLERSRRIYFNHPDLLRWATGIDDLDFFRNLVPTEFRKIEEAIEEANPAKKNVTQMMAVTHLEMTARILASGLTPSTSSAQDITSHHSI